MQHVWLIGVSIGLLYRDTVSRTYNIFILWFLVLVQPPFQVGRLLNDLHQESLTATPLYQQVPLQLKLCVCILMNEQPRWKMWQISWFAIRDGLTGPHLSYLWHRCLFIRIYKKDMGLFPYCVWLKWLISGLEQDSATHCVHCRLLGCTVDYLLNCSNKAACLFISILQLLIMDVFLEYRWVKPAWQSKVLCFDFFHNASGSLPSAPISSTFLRFVKPWARCFHIFISPKFP